MRTLFPKFYLDKMELTIPLVIDQTTPIPKQLDPSFVITERPIGENIRIVCRKDNCDYVAKFIKIGSGFYKYGPGTDPNCYTGEDVIRNEIFISQLAGRLNVGPRVHAASLDGDEGILVIDKYDGTLDDLIYLSQRDPTIPMDKIMETVARLLQILHQNGIVHRDFHPGNIFYTKGGIFAVGDYGASLLSDNPILRELDWGFYRGIQEVIEKVKRGARYEGFFEMSTPPPNVPKAIHLIWKGRSCLDLVG
jgi:hypothetical protein